MGHGVLATVPDTSACCDKPTLAPAALDVSGAAPDGPDSQEHAAATTAAAGLPGSHHLVRGGRSLFGQVEDDRFH